MPIDLLAGRFGMMIAANRKVDRYDNQVVIPSGIDLCNHDQNHAFSLPGTINFSRGQIALDITRRR